MRVQPVEKPIGEPMDDLHTELIRLQRQFRLLEDDRRAYKEETEHILKKQEETFCNLQFEHEELTKDFKLSGCLTNQITDASNTKTLRHLLDDEDETKQIFKAHCEKLSKVNEEIKQLLQAMDAHRMKLGGCQESERKCKAMIKSKHVMEDRLNEANIKYNIALGRNNSLRQEIDHVNAQRKRFQDLHQKLSKMLEEGKEEKESVIEKANALFSSREEAQNRMELIRERFKRDQNFFYSELRDLKRVIDHDRSLRDFMITKLEDRTEIFGEIVQERSEKKLSDRNNILQNQIEVFESIFQKLKEVKGIEDTDDLVEAFINVEDRNYALFKFVKEQKQRMQSNESAIKKLEEKKLKVQKEEIILGKKHKEMLESLEEKETKKMADEKDASLKLKKDSSVLEEIKGFLDKMMNKVKCSNRMMELGCSDLTNENIMCYLGLIEERAGELVQQKLSLDIKRVMGNSSKENENKSRIGFLTVGLIARYVVAPPSLSSEIPDEIAVASSTIDFPHPLNQYETRVAALQASKGEKENKMESLVESEF